MKLLVTGGQGMVGSAVEGKNDEIIHLSRDNCNLLNIESINL